MWPVKKIYQNQGLFNPSPPKFKGVATRPISPIIPGASGDNVRTIILQRFIKKSLNKIKK